MAYTVNKTGEFDRWLKSLTDHKAQDAILARIVRIQSGALGDHRSVGGKVGEFRMDVSGGYRLYFIKSGLTIVLLLCGGTKRSQDADISKAQAMAELIAKAKKEAAKKKRGKK